MIKLTEEIPFLRQLKWRNHDDIWNWCRQNHIVTMKDQEKWCEKVADDPTIQMFGIWASYKTSDPTLVDEKLDYASNVGTCGLTSINYHHRHAEFSLFIGPEYQGKGAGKQALIKLLDYGFNRLNLHMIYGEVMDGNPALEMFKSIGFKEGGYHRSKYFKHREYIGATHIDMLATEFNERWK